MCMCACEMAREKAGVCVSEGTGPAFRTELAQSQLPSSLASLDPRCAVQCENAGRKGTGTGTGGVYRKSQARGGVCGSGPSHLTLWPGVG